MRAFMCRSCMHACMRVCAYVRVTRRECASRTRVRAEANWSAVNERGRKSKQEREGQSGFLRDGETKKGIQLEKRQNEFTREADGEHRGRDNRV